MFRLRDISSATEVRAVRVPLSTWVDPGLTAVGLDDFQGADRVSVADPKIIAAIAALVEASGPEISGSNSDLRYALHFVDGDRELAAIYLDGYGLHGEIDGKSVDFQHPPLLDDLDALFSQQSSNGAIQ